MAGMKTYKVKGAPGLKQVVLIPYIEKFLSRHGTTLETRAAIPLSMIPSFKAGEFIRRGVENHVVLVNEGGLGDQVCAEPTMRRVFREFAPGCKISLLSPNPALFSHLPWEKIYTRANPPDWGKTTSFSFMPPNGDLSSEEFCVHKEMHCVDYASMRIFRGTIPDPKDREIVLPALPFEMNPELEGKHPELAQALLLGPKGVVCHPGRTWQSRTLPKDWWDAVLRELQKAGMTPILIGYDNGGETGFVDVDATGCVDLRNKLNTYAMAALLKRAHFVLSNDSSPIHLAAAGNAFIGFVTTVRHPGYLTHWRRGEFGYQTRNFGKDGLWNHEKRWPPKSERSDITRIPEELLRACLPTPMEVVGEYSHRYASHLVNPGMSAAEFNKRGIGGFRPEGQ